MAAASAPSPSFPTKTSETISPTASLISPPPSPPLSQPPPVSLSSPPISQPNATPDIPAPPLASPPTLSPPPPLLSPPPPLPSPITLSPPPPVPTVPVTAPPPVPVTSSPPPPQTTTTPSPPLPTSPPLSPPNLSPPPPSLSPPSPTVPAVPTVPAPKASPFSSPPPPSRKHPLSPPSSSSSPPPSSPSLSTSPPLPSPNPNTSIIPATPPINQFPLATPTSPNNSGSNSPDSNKSSNSGFNQGGNNNNNKNNNNNNSSSNGGGLSTGASVSIAIVTIFLLASFIVAGIWYVKKKKRPVNGYNSVFIMPSPTTPAATSSKLESPLARYPQTPFGYNSSGSQNLVNSKYFSYEELHEITEGFSVNNVLGEGGFGIVYKGRLPDGRQVAVKRLTGGGGQGEREFQAEVEIISRVHHRHLVSLVGYCSENEQRVLVYDFVPNNTLHYHLHGKDRPVLEWGIRVKIAAGAARGIAYLHEDCQPRIIHRDIKSSNILLDEDFEALVADFGLARLALDACTHVTTRVMGTFGYLAPEYASSGKLTERSDVFSYGVVLLELVTGRKPVDSSLPLGDESLVEWARPLLTGAIETGKFEEIIDPKLGNNYNKVEMVRMIEAAAACVRHSASRRPKMSQVVRVFDSLADVDLTNGVQPGKSELFNVANSAEIRLFQRMAFANDFDFSAEFSHTSASLNSNSNLNPNNYRRL